MTVGVDTLRLYAANELGSDGYPPEWHATIKHAVRAEAGNRCVRCGHPYTTGKHPMEREEDEDGNVYFVSWTPCDKRCTHGGPIRVRIGDGAWTDAIEESVGVSWTPADWLEATIFTAPVSAVEARSRILTVHHLDGDKANCRWWNLASLCQRCHLTIQGRVQMARVWPWEHSEWFRPYVAGYYAFVYLGEELDRPATEARMDELLALERVA